MSETPLDLDAIELRETCPECPEQYDAFLAGVKVGYLRLRHGVFTVECPDCGGALVYSAEPAGDGAFDPEERDGYLSDARNAICGWLVNGRFRDPETSDPVSETPQDPDAFDRVKLEYYGLWEEFAPHGCDRIEWMAEALIAARAELRRLRAEAGTLDGRIIASCGHEISSRWMWDPRSSVRYAECARDGSVGTTVAAYCQPCAIQLASAPMSDFPEILPDGHPAAATTNPGEISSRLVVAAPPAGPADGGTDG